MSNFVSLHNQTVFSLLDSLCSVQGLFGRAKELNQTAIAITDHGTLAAAWDALKESKKTGIKLIIGCECYFTDDVANINQRLSHLILIAKNSIGYKNLLTINKLAFDQGKVAGNKVYPIIDWNLLKKYNDGLICLTACGNGILSYDLANGNVDDAESKLLQLKELFGDNLGVEVLANNMKRNATIFTHEIDQKFLNRMSVKLAKKYNIKIVAACNTHYLKKEEYETHDVLLAIGSKSPKYSNFRLKYNVNDFYLKSEEEMISFFSRNFGEAEAKEMVYNSKVFADMCEFPEWIDPKYSNPSGKELPIFPIKDEPDYNDFKSWLAVQTDEIKKIDEDKAYLRYKCYNIFKEKIKSDNIPASLIKEYNDRINRELNVFEKLDISSYMLITADFLNYARKNDISVGPGRGCLFGDTEVLTSQGFKQLKNIEIGNQVYTHTGHLQTIFNKFEYDIDEGCLEIKCENSFGKLQLTKDHKILGAFNKKEEFIKYYTYEYNKNLKYKGTRNVPSDLEWIKANNLNIGDYVYTKFPNNQNNDDYVYKIDLVDFIPNNNDNYRYDDKNIYIRNNISNDFSIRKIQKNTKLGFNLLRSYKNNINKNGYNKDVLIKYLKNRGLSLEEWQQLPKYKYYPVNRFIKLDNDLLYVLGRWVGDGSLRHKGYGINIAFNKNEKNSIKCISNYFSKIGFNVYKNVSKVSNSISLDIGNKVLFNLFSFIFRDYKNSSETKHLPSFFRKLSNAQLNSLLKGVIDSDGYVNDKYERINTISKRLALELKECLNYLHIASAVYYEKANNKGNRNNAESFKINFSGIYRDKIKKHYYNEGYFSKIIKINKTTLNKVYDISVDNDTSYLTSSGVVHNSAGGSYVAYLLNIHCADSVKYGLVFERFHNELKTSMSDIDNDLLSSGREKIIQYVRNKYGDDNVASISNFNTITPKVYIRDIARSCELGGSREEAVKIGNAVADTVAADIKSIDAAFNNVPLFAEYCKKYPDFLQHKSISNQLRNFSTHAAGIVVNKRPLTGLVPLRRDKVGDLVLEYEKEKTEDNGLVKIDILGLKTLDVLKLTEELILKVGKKVPTINFEDNDEKTYKLIGSGKCDFIFQLGGSGGTMDLCRQIKPNNIEDLAIITTLARPGCRDIRKDFIATRAGKQKVTYPHKTLEGALKNTFGYALYDESLLILAKDTAGWDLAKADGLRKLTKLKGSKPKLAKQLQDDFILGCINNGLTKHDSEFIWKNVVEPFGKYSFNKSHAILYSIISYQTAYYKAHFPIEFLLANLMFEVKSNSPTAKSNIEKIKNEIRARKVKILPPNLNESQLAYTMVDDKTLLTGLDALKYVGEDAINDIISKRPFKSFQDFMYRVSSKSVRANTIQALAASGALDSFCNEKIRRKDIFLYCSDYRKKLATWKKTHDPNLEHFNYPWVEDKDWSLEEKYALEVYYLNEAFICKPYLAYDNFFNGKHVMGCHIKKAANKQKLDPIKGIVVDFFCFKVKKEDSKFYGMEMAKVTFEDKAGDRYGCTIFPDRWEFLKLKLKELNIEEFDVGIAISYTGTANLYEDNMGVILNGIYDIRKFPARPEDLKSKKASVRSKKERSKAIKEIVSDKNINSEGFTENIMDFLYEEGVVDLND